MEESLGRWDHLPATTLVTRMTGSWSVSLSVLDLIVQDDGDSAMDLQPNISTEGCIVAPSPRRTTVWNVPRLVFPGTEAHRKEGRLRLNRLQC